MKTTQFPYSDFLRGPNKVLPQLDEGDVVLERRNEENLVLTSFRRFASRQDGMNIAARLVADVARNHPELLAPLFTEELPWIRWLPESDRARCAEDLLRDLVAGADTGSLEPFARTLSAWRSTAEIWSDPELAHRLRGPFAGDGKEILRTHPAR
jgi:hypothetical protein